MVPRDLDEKVNIIANGFHITWEKALRILLEKALFDFERINVIWDGEDKEYRRKPRRE